MSLQVRKTLLITVLFLSVSPMPISAQTGGKEFDQAAVELAKRYLEEGRKTFCFDTFGSEDFWGGKLKLHNAVMGEKLGGVGAGVNPEQALKLGLKVDVDAIPKKVADALNKGEVDLTARLAPWFC
jgi:hypothetical protein